MKFIARGLFPVHLLDWKVLYEGYLTERRLQHLQGKNHKTNAAKAVADRYNISERSMFKVIGFMEG